MSEQITQRFGIDASDALATLSKLDAAYKDHAKAIDRVADAMKRSGRSTDGAMRALARSTDNSMAAATKSVERFHTSLALLSRIVFTQAVIKGMRLIEQGAVNSAKGFQDFEKGLSEIQALDPTTTLDDLARSSKNLSNQFNVKLMDVVAARLDLVGSGFTSAADQTKVFSAAAGLAKLGAASQAEASDLLISSLNAYGKSAESAARFSRVFFAGADKGRFTIKELSANLGKAAPAARAVGISIEELTSLFSALTNAGVNPAEAATQANAIAVSFIKPSEAMKQALANLKIESGQALIAQKGLSGAIQSVIKTTDGSAQSIGKLFINQRALRPILTLNANAWRTFNDHLANTQQLTQKEFDFRLAQRLGTDSETATAAVNRLTNAITIGLGGGITQTVANASRLLDQLSGRVDLLSSSIESFGRVITGHGIADLDESLAGFAKQSTNKILVEQNQRIQDQAQLLDRIKSTRPALAGLLDDALDLNKARAFQAGIDSLLKSIDKQVANTDLDSPIHSAVDQLKQLSTQSKVSSKEIQSLKRTFADIGGTAGALGSDTLDFIGRKQGALGQITPENLGKVQPAANALAQAALKLQVSSLTAEQALQRGTQMLLQLQPTLQPGLQQQQQQLPPEQQPAQQAKNLGTALQQQAAPAADKVKTSLQNAAPQAKAVTTSAQQWVFPSQQFATATQSAQQAMQALSTSGVQQLPTAFLTSAQSSQQLTAAIQQAVSNTASLVAVANQAAAAFAKAAQAAQQAAAAAAQAASAGAQSLATGGMVHLAAGGFAKGTDTIPAMLSPGEFVVNAKSTRQFFSQLQSINAGVAPVYRAEGGPATQNTFGDIAINVNGSASANATARAVMAEFRREVRRGTGTI